MRKKFVFTFTLLLVIGLLSACDSGNDEKAQSNIPENVALKITGEVEQEIGWAEADVQAMDTIDVESTNSKGNTDTYTGVSLNKLLDLAKVKAGATKLVFVADDGYTAEVALADVQSCTDCIVSFRSNGGFSIVMPGLDKALQVKGVVEIKVE